MNRQYFSNAAHAIRAGQQYAPCLIGFCPGRGWQIYKANSPPAGVMPELLCLALGQMPLALSYDGAAVLASAIAAQASTTPPAPARIDANKIAQSEKNTVDITAPMPTL